MIEPDRRARRQLWRRLRVLVIDLETTRDGSTYRIVSGAAFNVVDGKVIPAWHAFRVNPGVPIDSISQDHHQIGDSDVAGAPAFAEVMDDLARQLIEGPEETLVLAAHNARFDLPVLRGEIERAGGQMPELRVIDTMRELPALIDVAPQGQSLGALLDALLIARSPGVTAEGHARTTAEAVAQLLNRAADRGYFTIQRLLDRLQAPRATTLRFSRPLDREPATAPVLSADHQARDLVPLPAKPTKAEFAAWLASVEECAELRCPNLGDRVASAGPPGAVLLPKLVDSLRVVAALAEHAPAATLLGALLTRIAELPPVTHVEPGQGLRFATEAFEADLAPLVSPHPRCVHPMLCPACQTSEPCALDMWRHVLAPNVLIGKKGKTRSGNWIPTTGERIGKGGSFGRMRRSGHEMLADAGMREALRVMREDGQLDTAAVAASSALALGCMDPDVAEFHALAISAGGRKADLDAGLAVCDRILPLLDPASTDPAVLGLTVRRNQIAGRLRRLEGRRKAAGKITERHHPRNPKRSRAPRFLRV